MPAERRSRCALTWKRSAKALRANSRFVSARAASDNPSQHRCDVLPKRLDVRAHCGLGRLWIALAHGGQDRFVLPAHAVMLAWRAVRYEPETQRALVQTPEQLRERLVLRRMGEFQVKCTVEKHQLLDVAQQRPLPRRRKDAFQRGDVEIARTFRREP